jgi:hypothetical protein
MSVVVAVASSLPSFKVTLALEKMRPARRAVRLLV